MNASTGSPGPIRFALTVGVLWLLVMALTGVGVWGVYEATPKILLRDQESSAWHYQKEAWEILQQSPYGSSSRERALSQVEPLVAEAVSLAPQNVQYRTNHALILQEQGKKMAALDELEAALAITDSTEEAPYALYGEIATQLELWEKAEGPLRKAIEIDPTSPLHHERLAKSLLRQGKIDEGIEVLRHRIENLPAVPWNRMMAALEAVRVGRYQEAAEWFDIPAKEGQIKGKIWYAVAVSKAAVGDIDEAAAAFIRYKEDLNIHHIPSATHAPPGLEIGPYDEKTEANLKAAYRRSFSRDWK
ncbi:MAG: tetratricopeptide repeat protein [Candidatus Omnitrophica bacterium]|nr:tetratricopeptide repeat protein [Candidatus Omnitrophota bacterium]